MKREAVARCLKGRREEYFTGPCARMETSVPRTPHRQTPASLESCGGGGLLSDGCRDSLMEVTGAMSFLPHVTNMCHPWLHNIGS